MAGLETWVEAVLATANINMMAESGSGKSSAN